MRLIRGIFVWLGVVSDSRHAVAIGIHALMPYDLFEFVVGAWVHLTGLTRVPTNTRLPTADV